MVVQASLVPALLSLVLGLGPAGASAWHRNRRSPWDDNGWSPPVQTGLPHNPEMGIENMEELLAGGPAAPMPTTAPSRELFERAVLPNTCGFISGSMSYALLLCLRVYALLVACLSVCSLCSDDDDAISRLTILSPPV